MKKISTALIGMNGLNRAFHLQLGLEMADWGDILNDIMVPDAKCSVKDKSLKGWKLFGWTCICWEEKPNNCPTFQF